MELIYRSTRNANETATASQAILKGLANEGGLFVPDSIPALDVSLEDLAKMNYQQVAYEVMKLMFTDFTEDELKHCINSAYDSKFDTPVIAPLVNKAGAYYLELFHVPPSPFLFKCRIHRCPALPCSPADMSDSHQIHTACR